ncbi:MAG: hypothetical protein QUU85_00875 [Candidatus Eisenbacteria bacterium]|nr:hypothetical protein [Candidatus Eisenbacteria bacterium]
MRGTYVMLCGGERERPLALFYPFPRDSSMGGARMLSLSVRPGWKAPERPGLWEDLPGTSGARWWVPACEGDTIVLESVYRQRTDAGYARYIVTTTRPWGRPLKRASFEVRLPPGAIPLEWSFPFEPLPGGDAPGGETLYRYEARDFFPDRDIVVRWKP